MMITYDQDRDYLQSVQRHFLDQPLEFPFGQPDQLFDQHAWKASSQPDVRGGLDYFEGDYHLFDTGSREPEYFDPLLNLDYYDEGSGMDYDFGNLQEQEMEYQKDREVQTLSELSKRSNETAIEELQQHAGEGGGELDGSAQLRQADGFLPLESKTKEPEEEVKYL